MQTKPRKCEAIDCQASRNAVFRRVMSSEISSMCVRVCVCVEGNLAGKDVLEVILPLVSQK